MLIKNLNNSNSKKFNAYKKSELVTRKSLKLIKSMSNNNSKKFNAYKKSEL